ncbi:MAG: tRNA pseudouridine(38-40) synthase TruA [Bryobacteraceae bacterium]
MRRIKLTLSYDGTDFHGWQVQPGKITIQGVLEEVLAGIDKKPVPVAGSGRTDAGVHALAQVAAVTLENPLPLYNLRKAVNRLLPDTIRLVAAEEVAASFHPRFDAVSKTYEYRIVRSEVCSPFERRYVHHHPYPLDVSRMLEAAPLFAGEHDFGAFAASDRRDAKCESKVRLIYRSNLEALDDRLIYRVTGSGFLKHMVRNIVGTMLEAGRGNVTPEKLAGFLKGGPPKAGPTAPASGLTLIEVRYDGLKYRSGSSL